MDLQDQFGAVCKRFWKLVIDNHAVGGVDSLARMGASESFQVASIHGGRPVTQEGFFWCIEHGLFYACLGFSYGIKLIQNPVGPTRCGHDQVVVGYFQVCDGRQGKVELKRNPGAASVFGEVHALLSSCKE